MMNEDLRFRQRQNDLIGRDVARLHILQQKFYVFSKNFLVKDAAIFDNTFRQFGATVVLYGKMKQLGELGDLDGFVGNIKTKSTIEVGVQELMGLSYPKFELVFEIYC